MGGWMGIFREALSFVEGTGGDCMSRIVRLCGWFHRTALIFFSLCL